MGKRLAIRIVEILFYVLFGVSLLFAVLFFVQGNKEDLLLYWTYVLTAISISLVLILSIMGMFKSKQTMISSLVVLGLFGALIFGCYAFSSDIMPTFFGADAFKLTPSGLKWIDTSLFMTYILMGGSFVGLVFTEIRAAFN